MSLSWNPSGGSPTGCTTITLSAPVHAGDLLAGWFGQYSSSGQVKVSDSINGGRYALARLTVI